MRVCMHARMYVRMYVYLYVCLSCYAVLFSSFDAFFLTGCLCWGPRPRLGFEPRASPKAWSCRSGSFPPPPRAASTRWWPPCSPRTRGSPPAIVHARGHGVKNKLSHRSQCGAVRPRRSGIRCAQTHEIHNDKKKARIGRLSTRHLIPYDNRMSTCAHVSSYQLRDVVSQHAEGFSLDGFQQRLG